MKGYSQGITGLSALLRCATGFAALNLVQLAVPKRGAYPKASRRRRRRCFLISSPFREYIRDGLENKKAPS